MDTLIGTSIGGYVLIKLLGVGGMGSVYLANDPAIDQQVAVKVIRTEMDAYTDSVSAQTALERFRQEARAVARLDHLHILPLYRYGEEKTPLGQRAYMIMQYRPEGSLWDWLRRRADFAAGSLQPSQAELSSGLPLRWPLALDEAAEYLHQAASALQYAHDRGIVHRDIKPANFLLRIDLPSKNVHLLLSDFGLAKVFTASSATNTILGTPTYMAPEQFEGSARPESDQYALAVMVYYMLAGRPPFEGDPMRLMRQHLSAEVPLLTTFNSTLPLSMNGLFARALAKQPEQRFPSVTAFAEAFASVVKQPHSLRSQFSVQGTLSPLPVTPERRDMLLPHASSGSSSPAPLVLPDPASGAGVYNNTQTPAHYPTPVSVGGMQYASNSYMQPTTAAPAFAPTYTPAALPVSQARETQVSRRGALGWLLGATVVAAAGTGVGLYFYTQNNRNAPATSSGGTQNLILYKLTGHAASVTSLSWLPGGSQLASGSLDATARLWSAADGSAGTVFKAASAIRTLAWSPGGNMLATGEDGHVVQLWDVNGTPIKREDFWGAPVYSLAWRGDSHLLFIGTYGNSIHALSVPAYKRYGKNGAVHLINIAISHNNRYLALALTGGEVYFMDLAKAWAITARFPATHGTALSLAWSPDDSMIAVGYADKNVLIYDTNSHQVQYTLKHSAPVYSVAWSPAGASSLLASGAGDGTVNIWKLAATQQDSQQFIYHGHTNAVLAVAWSTSLLASASKDRSVILWQPPAS